ncbi:ABC transporter substrate-binding protein [Cohnella thailandensis]|uniref:ABC transporter substrate-binding protein n=2 Tax=Cohnella thailandensis TaxID=557557 RepID=A0A841T5F9_9BACL|nr:ABC transporter substrate-binding protein [Cohnella thailandensis]MBB6636371.1 ABC transporter substrate-binding protein [Cohnella thailandensis]
MVLLLLQGCNATPSVSPAASADPDRPPSIQEWRRTSGEDVRAEKPLVIGFSQLGSESAWRMANTASVREAAKESGISLLLENAEQSQPKQFEAVREFIRRKVDVIAIAPVVESGWSGILQEAKLAGIPVVILDRSVNVEDTSLFVTTIGSDFYEEGVKAGKYLLDRMQNQAGPIRIAELQGTAGSSPSIQRGEGFRSVVKARTDMVITQSAPADFTENKGKEVMQELLQVPVEERPQVLFAHNDDMAIGAIEAIKEAGLRPGKDIVILSVDGSRSALQLLNDGELNAVVECNPLLGPLLMQAAKEIMAGRSLPKRMIPPEDIFTQERAEHAIQNRKF